MKSEIVILNRLLPNLTGNQLDTVDCEFLKQFCISQFIAVLNC